MRKLNELLAAETRVSATAIQTVGIKGYDGFAVALVLRMSTILISGAGRGLGSELARQYAAEGWKVIGTVRSPKAEVPAGVERGSPMSPIQAKYSLARR